MDGDLKKIKVSITAGTIIKTLVIIAVFGLILYIKDVVLAVLASVVISSALEPYIRRIVSWRIPRTGAVVAIYLALAFLIGAFFYFMFPVIITEFLNLTKALPDLIKSFNLKNADVSAFEKAVRSFSTSDTFGEYFTSVSNVFSSFGQSPLDTVTYLFGGVSSAIIIVVLSFYLSAQKDGVSDFLRIVTPLHHESYVVGLWKRSQRHIGRWMQGQVILGVIVGVFVYIGLRILGIRHALLLSIVSGVFEIIPVFGPILGSIPGIIVGFIDGGISLSLLVAGLYVIIQQLESNVVYPLVVKKIIGVPPLIVIISLIVGFTLGGFLGVILSVPVATMLMEYLHDRERDRRVA